MKELSKKKLNKDLLQACYHYAGIAVMSTIFQREIKSIMLKGNNTAIVSPTSAADEVVYTTI